MKGIRFCVVRLVGVKGLSFKVLEEREIRLYEEKHQREQTNTSLDTTLDITLAAENDSEPKTASFLDNGTKSVFKRENHNKVGSEDDSFLKSNSFLESESRTSKFSKKKFVHANKNYAESFVKTPHESFVQRIGKGKDKGKPPPPGKGKESKKGKGPKDGKGLEKSRKKEGKGSKAPGKGWGGVSQGPENGKGKAAQPSEQGVSKGAHQAASHIAKQATEVLLDYDKLINLTNIAQGSTERTTDPQDPRNTNERHEHRRDGDKTDTGGRRPGGPRGQETGNYKPGYGRNANSFAQKQTTNDNARRTPTRPRAVSFIQLVKQKVKEKVKQQLNQKQQMNRKQQMNQKQKEKKYFVTDDWRQPMGGNQGGWDDGSWEGWGNQEAGWDLDGGDEDNYGDVYYDPWDPGWDQDGFEYQDDEDDTGYGAYYTGVGYQDDEEYTGVEYQDDEDYNGDKSWSNGGSWKAAKSDWDPNGWDPEEEQFSFFDSYQGDDENGLYGEYLSEWGEDWNPGQDFEDWASPQPLPDGSWSDPWNTQYYYNNDDQVYLDEEGYHMNDDQGYLDEQGYYMNDDQGYLDEEGYYMKGEKYNGKGNKSGSKGKGNKSGSKGKGNKSGWKGKGNKSSSKGKGNKSGSKGKGNKSGWDGKGSYDPLYDGSYDPNDSGSYDQWYDGSYVPDNSGSYDQWYDGSYDPNDSGSYDQWYDGSYDPNDSGPYDQWYDGSYVPDNSEYYDQFGKGGKDYGSGKGNQVESGGILPKSTVARSILGGIVDFGLNKVGYLVCAAIAACPIAAPIMAIVSFVLTIGVAFHCYGMPVPDNENTLIRLANAGQNLEDVNNKKLTTQEELRVNMMEVKMSSEMWKYLTEQLIRTTAIVPEPFVGYVLPFLKFALKAGLSLGKVILGCLAVIEKQITSGIRDEGSRGVLEATGDGIKNGIKQAAKATLDSSSLGGIAFVKTLLAKLGFFNIDEEKLSKEDMKKAKEDFDQGKLYNTRKENEEQQGMDNEYDESWNPGDKPWSSDDSGNWYPTSDDQFGTGNEGDTSGGRSYNNGYGGGYPGNSGGGSNSNGDYYYGEEGWSYLQTEGGKDQSDWSPVGQKRHWEGSIRRTNRMSSAGSSYLVENRPQKYSPQKYGQQSLLEFDKSIAIYKSIPLNQELEKMQEAIRVELGNFIKNEEAHAVKEGAVIGEEAAGSIGSVGEEPGEIVTNPIVNPFSGSLIEFNTKTGTTKKTGLQFNHQLNHQLSHKLNHQLNHPVVGGVSPSDDTDTTLSVHDWNNKKTSSSCKIFYRISIVVGTTAGCGNLFGLAGKLYGAGSQLFNRVGKNIFKKFKDWQSDRGVIGQALRKGFEKGTRFRNVVVDKARAVREWLIGKDHMGWGDWAKGYLPGFMGGKGNGVGSWVPNKFGSWFFYRNKTPEQLQKLARSLLGNLDYNQLQDAVKNQSIAGAKLKMLTDMGLGAISGTGRLIGRGVRGVGRGVRGAFNAINPFR